MPKNISQQPQPNKNNDGFLNIRDHIIPISIIKIPAPMDVAAVCVISIQSPIVFYHINNTF